MKFLHLCDHDQHFEVLCIVLFEGSGKAQSIKYFPVCVFHLCCFTSFSFTITLPLSVEIKLSAWIYFFESVLIFASQAKCNWIFLALKFWDWLCCLFPLYLLQNYRHVFSVHSFSELQGGTPALGVSKPQWQILQRMVSNPLISSLQYLFSPDCMKSNILGYGAKAPCPGVSKIFEEF